MKEKLSEEEFYASLPRKRMGAGVIFLNEEQKVLLVKMSYKDGWGIPGGVVDAHESPLQGALREVKEELNLTISKETLSLVCLGYYSGSGYKTESLQFMFYGGVLTQEQIENISLQEDELTEYRFFEKEEAIPLLSNPKLGKRVRKSFEAIEKNTFYYLDN